MLKSLIGDKEVGFFCHLLVLKHFYSHWKMLNIDSSSPHVYLQCLNNQNSSNTNQQMQI